MTVKRNAEFMRMPLEKAIEQYLATLATEGKSPSYIDWLKDRPRYFTVFIHKIHGGTLNLWNLPEPTKKTTWKRTSCSA
jgi:hypothetical protein